MVVRRKKLNSYNSQNPMPTQIHFSQTSLFKKFHKHPRENYMISSKAMGPMPRLESLSKPILEHDETSPRKSSIVDCDISESSPKATCQLASDTRKSTNLFKPSSFLFQGKLTPHVVAHNSHSFPVNPKHLGNAKAIITSQSKHKIKPQNQSSKSS